MILDDKFANRSRKPVCLALSILTPPIFFPVSIFIGSHYGPDKDAYGFGALWTMVVCYFIAALICWTLAIIGWMRGERPRFLAFIAFALSIAPVYWIH
jgi:hypothetical protein